MRRPKLSAMSLTRTLKGGVSLAAIGQAAWRTVESVGPALVTQPNPVERFCLYGDWRDGVIAESGERKAAR